MERGAAGPQDGGRLGGSPSPLFWDFREPARETRTRPTRRRASGPEEAQLRPSAVLTISQQAGICKSYTADRCPGMQKSREVLPALSYCVFPPAGERASGQEALEDAVLGLLLGKAQGLQLQKLVAGDFADGGLMD